LPLNPGSILWAADMVNVPARTSLMEIRRLAAIPVDTDAYAAKIPTRGFLPTERNSRAARGGRTIHPASPAWFAMMPANTTITVTVLPLALAPASRTIEVSQPLFSARPQPSIIVSTAPSGANPRKLLGKLINIF